MSTITPHPSSYRDPSGFIFEKDGILYRQVNQSFRQHFDHFIQSGCYDHLVKRGLLVPHRPLPQNLAADAAAYITLQPERVPFISYPYEWSFDMLKDAALLTLQLVREALPFGMILKDATPYNIQWYHGRLSFIDTLSLEKYEERPWIAYRQFCEQLLSPLLLMHYAQQSLQPLLLAWPDGIPLAVTRALLPRKTRFSLHTYLHIHLHAKMGAAKKNTPDAMPHFPRRKLLNIISSLETLVHQLRFAPAASTWSGYYEEAGQRNGYLEEKKAVMARWLDRLSAIHTAVDLGANEGVFARIAASRNINVIATDADAACINRLYQLVKNNNEKNILPLVLDLANPSPAIGLNNEERSSFISRTSTELVIALALIHHLAIGRNIPFAKIAALFARLGHHVIVEFVPKSDPKVMLMLSAKQDIYTDYTEAHFLSAFSALFDVQERYAFQHSGRVLFLLKRKNIDHVA